MTQIFTVPKNDTYPLTITVAHATLANYPTGLAAFSKFWFYGKYGVNDPDTPVFTGGPAAVFKKTETTGISVLTAGSPTVDGVLQVVLQPADTNGIPVDTPVSLQCSLKGWDGTNDYTFESDIVILVKTQATSKVS